MKDQLLKILLYLCCFVALGIDNGTHYFLSGDEYSCYTCNSDFGFEDDICFDILVHSMQFDLVENNYNFDITLSKRPVEWLATDVDPITNGATINLPLRAPPLVG